MKMCESHWQLLRDAIKQRGLWHLVSRSGEEAAAIVEHELVTGEETRFDPLMSALMMINSKTIETVGMEIFHGETEAKENCPICFLMAKCECGKGPACDFANWITYAADSARKHALERKLLTEH